MRCNKNEVRLVCCVGVLLLLLLLVMLKENERTELRLDGKDQFVLYFFSCSFVCVFV